MSSTVLKTLFEKGYNSDVLLSVKGYNRTQPAHRFILCAASKYFETQLAVVKSEDKTFILDMSFNTMKTIIRFIYTKELQPEPTSVEEIEKLMKASEKLGVDILETLRSPIAKVKNVANISELMNLDQYWCDDKVIEEDLTKYFGANLKEIRREKSFLSITMEGRVFEALINMQCLKLDSEKDVFDMIEQWINHDYPGRYQYFLELMYYIRYVADDPKRIDVNFIMNNLLRWCNCKESKLHLIHLMGFMAGYDSKVYEIITKPRDLIKVK